MAGSERMDALITGRTSGALLVIAEAPPGQVLKASICSRSAIAVRDTPGVLPACGFEAAGVHPVPRISQGSRSLTW